MNPPTRPLTPTEPGKGSPDPQFTRLPDVPIADVLTLLNEPRNRRHMPLSTLFDEASARDWVRAKDAQWDEHGYGPWAIMIDDRFAGWGGFQREPNGADFALVLSPPFWGHGVAVAEEALRIGFTELRLEAVLIALPTSRRPDRVVGRFGFEADGEVIYDRTTFRQFRLTADRWRRHQSPDR